MSATRLFRAFRLGQSAVQRSVAQPISNTVARTRVASVTAISRKLNRALVTTQVRAMHTDQAKQNPWIGKYDNKNVHLHLRLDKPNEIPCLIASISFAYKEGKAEILFNDSDRFSIITDLRKNMKPDVAIETTASKVKLNNMDLLDYNDLALSIEPYVRETELSITTEHRTAVNTLEQENKDLQSIASDTELNFHLNRLWMDEMKLLDGPQGSLNLHLLLNTRTDSTDIITGIIKGLHDCNVIKKLSQRDIQRLLSYFVTPSVAPYAKHIGEAIIELYRAKLLEGSWADRNYKIIMNHPENALKIATALKILNMEDFFNGRDKKIDRDNFDLLNNMDHYKKLNQDNFNLLLKNVDHLSTINLVLERLRAGGHFSYQKAQMNFSTLMSYAGNSKVMAELLECSARFYIHQNSSPYIDARLFGRAYSFHSRTLSFTNDGPIETNNETPVPSGYKPS